MSTLTSTRRLDHSALKTNQAFIIGVALVGFILAQPALIAFLAGMMLVGTAVPSLSFFKQLYFRILRPTGVVKPRLVEDDPAPHRFAQGFGGVVLVVAAALLIQGATLAGWALTWLVVSLAALNLLAGFCAGCFLYYQLRRRGFPGFAPAVE